VKLLDSSVSNLVPQSFTPDGRKLAYHQGTKTVNQRDIFVLPLDASDPDHPKTGVPETFLATDAVEADPVFSPDGRWLAYIAGSQGAFHVYVRPYPEGAQGGLVQISTVPGRFPMWSQTRKEIFYVANDGQIQVVPYTINGRTFTAGKPRVWSNTAVQVEGVAYPLDIAPNGKSFAATLAPETNTGEKFHLHVTFLVNFFDELKRKLP
jgi:serine/threonine-protein kinase